MLALSLQDLNDALQQERDRPRSSKNQQVTDKQIALQFQLEEYEQMNAQLTDIRMAQSIGRAVQDDGASVVVLAGAERHRAADREMALLLSGQELVTRTQMLDLKIDDDSLLRYSAFNVINIEGGGDLYATSTVKEDTGLLAGQPGEPPRARGECTACLEDQEILQMPCEDCYCRTCTVRLFADSLHDETLYPPKCCGKTIPISLAQSFLGSDLATRFERKAIEFGTQNRTYCCATDCATFIEPGYIAGAVGTCPKVQCGR